MIKILPLLSPEQIAQLTAIAARAPFADGRISNPHSSVKNNQQLHDTRAYHQSSAILLDALVSHPEFHEFTFPQKVAPPMITKYAPGQHYGLHADSAVITLPDGPLRSDISCTIFLSEPERYDGGALHLCMGDQHIRFREAAGTAVLYPSTMLHEVEPVTRGERLVAISFIESKIADLARRNLLFELNEVAALEGNGMDPANYARLQLVQANLTRMWAAA